MKVFVSDTENPGKRKLVECTLIKDRPTTILVKLPDGAIITRKKKRDLPLSDVGA